jgi:hypothetical protein
MKADQDRLEETLRTAREARKTQGSAECPPLENLARLVLGEAGRRERRRTLDHVAGCGECAKILRSLLRISDEFDRLAAAEAPRPKPGLVPGRRAAVAALAALAGVIAVTYAVVRLAERPVVRGTAEVEVRLVSPKPGATLEAAEIELRWEAVPKAADYRVQLFDASLAKLWQSASLEDASLKLPAEARAALREGESYFWRVTATLDDGQEVASKLAEFTVSR